MHVVTFRPGSSPQQLLPAPGRRTRAPASPQEGAAGRRKPRGSYRKNCGSQKLFFLNLLIPFSIIFFWKFFPVSTGMGSQGTFQGLCFEMGTGRAGPAQQAAWAACHAACPGFPWLPPCWVLTPSQVLSPDWEVGLRSCPHYPSKTSLGTGHLLWGTPLLPHMGDPRSGPPLPPTFQQCETGPLSRSSKNTKCWLRSR